MPWPAVPAHITDPAGRHDLVGVVDPLFLAGGRGQDDGRWQLRLSLAAWRLDDGPVVTGDLTLVLPDLTHDELRRCMAQQTGGDVVRATIGPPGPDGITTSARLLSPVVVVEAPDPEVAAARDAIVRPVVTDHPRGRLVHERSEGGSRLPITWAGRPVSLLLVVDAPEDAVPLLDRIGPWLDRSAVVDGDLRRRVVADLGDVLDGWVEPGDVPVTPAELAARIVIQAVSVRPDGSYEVDYDDDDIFLGHVVLVSGTVAAGPVHASIAG